MASRNKFATLKRIRLLVTIFCIIGAALSYYAHYVETNKQKNNNYKAFCDISSSVSCSKVFSSK